VAAGGKVLDSQEGRPDATRGKVLALGGRGGVAMRTRWLLAPVLLGALAVTQDAMKDRIEAALPPGVADLADTPARRTLEAALRSWRAAYRRAEARGGADELIDAGDVYRRLGEASGTPAAFDDKARRIYALALARARREESVHAVLRVAEAFAALGDRPAVERALAIARSLAASDPEARADVRAFAARLTSPAAADLSDSKP
jgi:hypothetical protein